MKKLLLLFQLSIINYQLSTAQNPLVKQWDKRFGGALSDRFNSIQQTSDGGYILGGYTESDSSGDKTQNTKGGFDYWIVKTDSLGMKQWDKDFGGTNHDILFSIKQTTDGGYILGGHSGSGISGDKTQPTWGVRDYWIVKIDSLGNKEWDKDFGGTNMDELADVQQTADRGYILGGYSYSGISGDKTQDNIDTTWYTCDYWIVKTDSLGNKQWDKTFGGSCYDNLWSIQQTADGGYILGGHSCSDSSGDKSQPSWGGYDYWIIKTDSLGNKQWDKGFGGTDWDVLYSVQQTGDDGYILGGWSKSGMGGNKTQPLWDTCTLCFAGDYWIVKTDSLGNKQWDKDFGGISPEDDYAMTAKATDGGFLIAGTSGSPISGNKTEANLGYLQTWVVKTDSLGNIQWDKTVHSTEQDHRSHIIETRDGCFLMASDNFSGIGGDKSQPSQGAWDYWIIKFCDTTLTTSINPISNFLPILSGSISPNPFHESVVISSEPGEKNKCDIIVKDIEGRILLQTPNSRLPAKLDLGFLSKGIYLLEINLDGERVVKKIVKE